MSIYLGVSTLPLSKLATETFSFMAPSIDKTYCIFKKRCLHLFSATIINLNLVQFLNQYQWTMGRSNTVCRSICCTPKNLQVSTRISMAIGSGPFHTIFKGINIHVPLSLSPGFSRIFTNVCKSRLGQRAKKMSPKKLPNQNVCD